MKLLRRMAVPATESQLAWVLAFSLIMMAGLLMIVLWQSNVIAYQRDLIRSLWSWKFAG